MKKCLPNTEQKHWPSHVRICECNLVTKQTENLGRFRGHRQNLHSNWDGVNLGINLRYTSKIIQTLNISRNVWCSREIRSIYGYPDLDSPMKLAWPTRPEQDRDPGPIPNSPKKKVLWNWTRAPFFGCLMVFGEPANYASTHGVFKVDPQKKRHIYKVVPPNLAKSNWASCQL
jgi:hypothetical protein